MLRSNAASLYGWDILLRGTCWPGPRIGARLAQTVRLPQRAGHEVGLHAWDHHSWQVNVDRYSPQQMRAQLRLGFDALSELLGAAPTCSAAAGWRCNEQALRLKEEFHFLYNSDCRGSAIFHPLLDGRALTPQIPVTAPTYDEVIGSNGIDNDNYNDYVLSRFKPGQLNVYTVHAEAEGIALSEQFARLLQSARERGIAFQPLGELLRAHTAPLPGAAVIKRALPGREGWLAWQDRAA
jgi:undecaprenyl phosphate-alpha-L-ara4FN deformylase